MEKRSATAELTRFAERIEDLRIDLLFGEEGDEYTTTDWDAAPINLHFLNALATLEQAGNHMKLAVYEAEKKGM